MLDGGAELNRLTERIIGRLIAVHRELGPGLLESTYERCAYYELSRADLDVRCQVAMPVKYRSVEIDCGYRIDLLIEEQVILELKSVTRTLPIHDAQLLAYLKLANLRVGLLVNFNVVQLTKGLKRVVNDA